MAGSVDKIKDIFFSAIKIFHLYGVAFYGDALLFFQVHVVQDLGLHVTHGEGLGEFDEPIGKGTLAMVYVSDYAEIAYMLHNCKNNQIVVHLKDRKTTQAVTDREIIDLYKDGQQEKAFKEIVDSYSERLYWHVRRFLCSHEDTDDLLQEIFIKIWSALPSFRGDSQLYTWLYRIATNEALNFLNKQKVRSALQFESMSSKLEDKIDENPWFNGDQLQRDLMKAIQRLPNKQKTVFTMRWFEEMSYEDISEILGTSVGALKASYHFAVEKIKAELEKNLK